MSTSTKRRISGRFPSHANGEERTGAIEAFAVEKLAETLNVSSEELDVNEPFINYGLDSLQAFTLTGDLAEWLDRDLEATLFWDHPCIADLSRYLAKS